MLFKNFFFLILFNLLLNAQPIDIKKLQKTFYNETVTINIYKKYFKTYLKEHCKMSDNLCIKNKILNITTWESSQNIKPLQQEIKKREQLTFISYYYFQQLITKITTSIENIKQTQYFTIVDLSKQLLIVVLYDKNSNKFFKIGADLISAGDINREIEVKKGEYHYLKTPTGVFKVTKGWRSDGKLSFNKTTLAYGQKGRFIYYLGKFQTIRYNSFDKNGNKIYDKTKWHIITDEINFAMHSHKSTAKMGTAYSHGCIRMTNELNYFLDTHLVLHKNFFHNGKWILKYAKEPQYLGDKNIMGEYLLVFDKVEL